MNNVSETKYSAPRAVRLNDARTAALTCLNGPQGTADVWQHRVLGPAGQRLRYRLRRAVLVASAAERPRHD
jgi:hypothetical protein